MQFSLNNDGQIFNKIESNKQKRTKDYELWMSFYAYARNYIRNVFVRFKPICPPYNAYERIKRTYSDRFKGCADKHKGDKNAAHPHLSWSKNFKYFQKRFHVSTKYTPHSLCRVFLVLLIIIFRLFNSFFRPQQDRLKILHYRQRLKDYQAFPDRKCRLHRHLYQQILLQYKDFGKRVLHL